MSRKTILLLVERFGQGGAEKVAAMVAAMLQESGHYDVHLYSIYESSTDVVQVQSGTLGIQPSKGVFQKLGSYYARINRLKKLKRKLGVSLTISSLWPVDWVNALTGRERKVAIIQINILNNVQNTKMVKYRKLVSSIYQRFDKIVLGSANLEQELTGFFGLDKKSLTVIHNPIDIALIEKNRSAPLLPNLAQVFSEYKVLVAAHRLNPIKNTEALLYIMSELKGDAEVKLLIIGEGEEKEKMQKLCAQLGLDYSQVENENFDRSATIYFLDFQKNIHNIIASSKLFLFPTKGEGLPLVLLEAMYCGIPVLVSDCPNGGVFEIMNPGGNYDPAVERMNSLRTAGGYLMPIPGADKKETIAEWVNRIREFLVADEQRLAEVRRNNRGRAAQFDKEILKQKWIDLVEGFSYEQKGK